MSPDAAAHAAFDAAIRGTVVLAGAGKMGGALLHGWLDGGLDPRRVSIVDPHATAETLQPFAERGVAVNPPAGGRAGPGTLVLAIKPQSLAGAAPALSPLAGPDTLVVSIIAGKTLADLARAFPAAGALARAMPNTPAAIGRGITGVFGGPTLCDAHRWAIDALLGAVGQVEWLADEAQIDAVTAVSGSGPAYVFYLTECLAEAAAALGLEPDAAARLARATVEGAAALMASQPGTPPAVLRGNVTSPGGTTAAALAVLMDGDRLRGAMTAAVAAARRRAVELAG